MRRFSLFCSSGDQIQALAQSRGSKFYLFVYSFHWLYTCACVCVRAHVCGGRCTHPCERRCRRPEVEGTHLQRRHSPLSPLFFNSHVELELYRSERLAAPWASGILLSTPPWCWHHRCMPPGLSRGCWAHALMPTQPTLYPLSPLPQKALHSEADLIVFPTRSCESISVSHQWRASSRTFHLQLEVWTLGVNGLFASSSTAQQERNWNCTRGFSVSALKNQVYLHPVLSSTYVILCIIQAFCFLRSIAFVSKYRSIFIPC